MKKLSNEMKIFLTAIILILPIGLGALIGILISHQGTDNEAMQSESDSNILSLSESEITFNIGSERKVMASLADESDSYVFQWNTSDKSIVSVKKDSNSQNCCQLTAEGKGSATVTVSIIDITKFKVVERKTCQVKVSDEKINFSMDEVIISLDKGNTENVTAFAPNGGEITWTSEDESIATVADGVITANKAGVVNVIAKSGNVESKLLVKIYNSFFALEEMKIVSMGQSEKIAVDGNVNSGVTWTSSDDRLVTVDSNGVITGHKMGMATVTATSKDDELVSTCVVIIKSDSRQSNVLAEGTKAEVAKHPGEWRFLCESELVTVSSTPCIENGILCANITGISDSGSNFFYLRYQPDDIGDVIYKNTTYIYSSVDDASIQINGQDYELKAGMNRIDLEYISEEIKDANPYQIKWKSKGQFYVIPIFEEISRIEKIVLSDERITLNTTTNKSFRLTATVPNQNNSVLNWTSSNKDVVVVSNGVITAVGEGSSMVTVVCGDLSAKCLVIVEGDTTITGKEIATGNKKNSLESPGEWFYLRDGKSALYNNPIIDSNGNVHLEIDEVDTEHKKYIYLRYQPKTKATYKAKITIDFAGEDGTNVDIAGGNVGATSTTLHNGRNTIEFTFTSDDTTPLQFKFNSAGNYVINVSLNKK